MKKLILLINLIILSFAAALAQTDTIYIKGKVTDSTGAVANKSVYIKIEASGNPFTFNSTVLTDGNGEYADKIEVPSPSEGGIEVSILNCKGEKRLERHYYAVSADADSNRFHINFNSCPSYKDGGCYASFSQKLIGERTVEFKIHIPDCKEIDLMLYFGDGSAQGMYGPAWPAYGDHIIWHKYPAKGFYNACLELKTDNGCDLYDCDTVNVAMEPGKYLIQGELEIDTSAYVGGIVADVYLIVYDPVQGTLTAVDTLNFAHFWGPPHVYSFGYVPEGQYLVKAALKPSPWYNYNMPTYYGDKLYWHEATQINLNSDRNDIDIHFIKGNNPGGPGFVGGYVSEGANRTSGPGDPLEGLSVLLTNLSGEPVAHACTDVNGAFTFESLALGTYNVTVEIPGKPSETYQAALTDAHLSDNAASFLVNSTNIILGTTGIEQELAYKIRKLYPNPASSELNLDLDMFKSQDVRVQIYDLPGSIMTDETYTLLKGVQSLSLDIDNLERGMYLLKLSTEKGILTSKFIKEN